MIAVAELPIDVTIQVQLIRILLDVFTPELSAHGQADSAGRQIEQIDRIDIQIQFGQLGGVDIFRMHSGKVHRRLIGRERRSGNGVNGLNGMVVPMKEGEVGSKMGSFAFRIRLNRETETSVPCKVFLIWL